MISASKYLSLAGCALLLAGCGHKVKPGKLTHEAGEAQPAHAKIFHVTLGMMTGRVDVIGTLVSAERVQISARLSAYLEEIHVSAGQKVRKGDVLALLDDREIQEQLSAAQAQLTQADSEWKRARQLFEKGAATEQMLVAAQSTQQAALAQVERVKVLLSYATVSAPMDGIVTERRIEAGDLANPGQVMLTLYNPMNMRLEAPVPVRLVERLKLGQRVEVTLDIPVCRLVGEVTEIVSEVDPLSRTQTVKVRLDQEGLSLLPGTFGRLWVEEAARPGILVPSHAVSRSGQLEMVRVADGSRMLKRLVRTGPAIGDQVEILSGLQQGESIVMDGGNQP